MTQDEAAQAFAAELRAATLAFGRKIGALDDFGNLTDKAIKTINELKLEPDAFKSPGNTYLDSQTKNVYMCDLNLDWQLVFNADRLKRKLEQQHNVKIMSMNTQENA